MRPPEINQSTQKEREEYIKNAFQCKGNCDICGFCAAFHGKSAETVYEDYILGKKNFLEAGMQHR